MIRNEVVLVSDSSVLVVQVGGFPRGRVVQVGGNPYAPVVQVEGMRYVPVEQKAVEFVDRVHGAVYWALSCAYRRL